MNPQDTDRALNAPAVQPKEIRRTRHLRLAIGVGAIGLMMAVASGQAEAQGMAPCAQIRAACEQVGFVQGGAREGTGLYFDCMRPIMLGMPQPPRASMPLPPVDPQLVAACRARNPNFAGPPGPGPGPGGPASAVRPPAPPRGPAPGEPTGPDQPPGGPDQPPMQGQSSPQPPQAGNPASQNSQAPDGANGRRNIVVVLTADLTSGAVSCRSPRQ
jgi:hypothetical protein